MLPHNKMQPATLKALDTELQTFHGKSSHILVIRTSKSPQYLWLDIMRRSGVSIQAKVWEEEIGKPPHRSFANTKVSKNAVKDHLDIPDSEDTAQNHPAATQLHGSQIQLGFGNEHLISRFN